MLCVSVPKKYIIAKLVTYNDKNPWVQLKHVQDGAKEKIPVSQAILFNFVKYISKDGPFLDKKTHLE